jgi:hypothetical protein
LLVAWTNPVLFAFRQIHAELIRSTRAPTKDRLIGKIMGGNPVFRGTRVPVHMLAELVASRVRAHAWTDGKCGKRSARREPQAL